MLPTSSSAQRADGRARNELVYSGTTSESVDDGVVGSSSRDGAIRSAVFEWFDRRVDAGQSEFSRSELESFEFEGEQIKLIDQSRGIRNPRQLDATLSVMTGWDSPYADEPSDGGLIRYDYRSGEGGDNIKLRRAAELGVPIVYLRATRPGMYVANHPVYVTDLPAERAVLLAIGEDMRLFGGPETMTEPQRRYAERWTKQRLHQPLFRAQVLHAYEQRCAVCSLRHVDLLDAAHIQPDSTEAGRPVVTNGVALCKIHHAAYDRDVIGLSPDYFVHVNAEIMLEVDGPMLRYGIQEMNGRPLAVPDRRRDRPDREGLSIRFEQFLRSA